MGKSIDFEQPDFADFDGDISEIFEMPQDFDSPSFEEIETRYLKPKLQKTVSEEKLFYERAEKLANDIELAPECRYYVIVNGSFIFGDFIEALIVSKNLHVKEMTISTLSLSQNNIDSLAGLLQGGYVEKLNVIVSAYWYAHERNELVPYFYQECDIDNKFQLAVAGSHCKLCIFETMLGNKVVIHGSANLRSSQNIEQIVIEENKELYDFNADFQNKIIEKYKTINKPIRVKTLWKTIIPKTSKK